MREEQIGLVRRSTGKVSARDKKRKEKRSDGEERSSEENKEERDGDMAKEKDR